MTALGVWCRRVASVLAGWGLPLLLLGCSDDERAPTRVVISEIMYHPVLESGPVEEHEFVELHNAGTERVSLRGWSLTGGIRFTFKADTALPPGEFLVLAKNRERLLELSRYGLPADKVVGNYEGQLDNDGEQIALLDERAKEVDRVAWSDGFPWPIGADALGAGESWLGPEDLPLDSHRHLGRSLERISATHPGQLPANWAASPLDGATPGRRNSATREAPLPIVEAIEAVPVGGTGRFIRPGEQTTVRVRFSSFQAGSSPGAPASVPMNAEVEFFVEDQQRTDEVLERVPLVARGEAFEATLPAQRESSVVRYRVVADSGSGRGALSPRPSDPARWHSYFVSPAESVFGRTPIYQLFITKARWEELWDNIADGRVPGNVGGGDSQLCAVNPRWDLRVPAILVIDGEVFDVQARYQGSRSNRVNGPQVVDPARWPRDGTRPDRPSPRVLSWHFNFPRWHHPPGRRGFNLAKLPEQSCQGLFATVGNALFESAGIPAARTAYVRLHINGSYYHFMQRLERVDEDLLRRYYGKDHVVGDLFKSEGARWDEGPWGWGDERILQPYCGFTAQQRYDHTYKRATLEDWKSGSAEVRALIEGLHAARAGGLPAIRAFFEQNFDVAALTNYLSVKNWMAAWDDAFQNHYLYRRSDGRWMILPTDLDNHFGFSPPSAPEASFFSGVENSRSLFREVLWNYVKDSFLRAFRQEFITRTKELAATVLHPDRVLPLIDAAASNYVVEEAKAAPAGVVMSPTCGGGDPAAVANRMKGFVRTRHERVLDGLFD